MKWVRGLSVLLLLVAGAAPAFAEDNAARTIEKGRWSLAFSLPDGGGAQFGVWKMVSGRSNVGINLGVDHLYEEETWGPDSARSGYAQAYFWTFSLQPSIKRYLFLRERVSPFVSAALQGSYGWRNSGRVKVFTKSATLSAGLGADWTPLRDVSIGASTGLEWTEGMSSANDFLATKEKTSIFDTHTGSLTLHLYF